MCHRTSHLFLLETEMNQKQMTDKQAMNLLVQICALYKGNLAEHELLQQALGLVGAKVFPAPMPVEKEPETLKPDFGGDKKETETVAE